MYTTLFTHIDVDELTVFFLQTLQRFIVRTAQTDVRLIAVLRGDTAERLHCFTLTCTSAVAKPRKCSWYPYRRYNKSKLVSF